jgi:RNA-splicing ligase RtcB
LSNHFIEIGKSNSDDYWLTIHTGSRNLGKVVCDYWQNLASKIVKVEKQNKLNEMIKNIRATYTGMEIKNQIRLARQSMGLDVIVNDSLQYLEGEDSHGYLFDMIFCQKYAETNRKYIAKIICENILRIEPIDQIETVHNFIDFKDFIIRKGAVRSYLGERLVIPFNSHDGILICTGKSSIDFNYSANHGCGRIMSRSQAKKQLSNEDVKNAMDGVYSSVKPKDESPLAYKDSKIIEEAIKPTVDVIDRIIPIINLKNGDDEVD